MSLIDIVNDQFNSAIRLIKDLDNISHWCKQWLMDMNPSKRESITFSKKRFQYPHPTLYLDGTALNEVTTHKHLGLTFM